MISSLRVTRLKPRLMIWRLSHILIISLVDKRDIKKHLTSAFIKVVEDSWPLNCEVRKISVYLLNMIWSGSSQTESFLQKQVSCLNAWGMKLPLRISVQTELRQVKFHVHIHKDRGLWSLWSCDIRKHIRKLESTNKILNCRICKFFFQVSLHFQQKIIHNLRLSASSYLKICLISTIDGTRHQDPS